MYSATETRHFQQTVCTPGTCVTSFLWFWETLCCGCSVVLGFFFFWLDLLVLWRYRGKTWSTLLWRTRLLGVKCKGFASFSVWNFFCYCKIFFLHVTVHPWITFCFAFFSFSCYLFGRNWAECLWGDHCPLLSDLEARWLTWKEMSLFIYLSHAFNLS